MWPHIYLMTLGLSLIAIVLVAAFKYSASAMSSWAQARDGGSIQSELADMKAGQERQLAALAELKAMATTASARLSSIETLLKAID